MTILKNFKGRSVQRVMSLCVCFQGAPGARGFPGADGAAGGKVSPIKTKAGSAYWC